MNVTYDPPVILLKFRHAHLSLTDRSVGEKIMKCSACAAPGTRESNA